MVLDFVAVAATAVVRFFIHPQTLIRLANLFFTCQSNALWLTIYRNIVCRRKAYFSNMHIKVIMLDTSSHTIDLMSVANGSEEGTHEESRQRKAVYLISASLNERFEYKFSDKNHFLCAKMLFSYHKCQRLRRKVSHKWHVTYDFYQNWTLSSKFDIYLLKIHLNWSVRLKAIGNNILLVPYF